MASYLNPLNKQKKKYPYSDALMVKPAADTLANKVSPFQTQAITPQPKPGAAIQPAPAQPPADTQPNVFRPQPAVTPQTQTTVRPNTETPTAVQPAQPPATPVTPPVGADGRPVTPTQPTQFDAASIYGESFSSAQNVRQSLQQEINSLPADSNRRRALELGLARISDYSRIIEFDNSFINSPPASVQSDADRQAWNTSLQNEMKLFQENLQKFPDQFDKIFQDHQTRMNRLKVDWDRTGKYESQLNDMLAQEFPGTKVAVQNVPAAQQNEFYQQAIAALQAGKSPQEIAGIYRSMFPAGYDFSIGAIPGATKENIDKYVPVGSTDITKSDAAIGKTDTTGINTSGQTQVGATVTQQQIDELKKELSAQGYTEAEKDAILRGDLQALEADKQAAIRSAVSAGAASGFGKTLGSIVNATAGTAQKYDAEAARLRGQVTQKGLDIAQERRQAGLAGLSDIATREAGIAGTQAQAGLGAAEIGSRENIAGGQLQLAKDSLYQEGQLTKDGQQIDQALKGYGFSLEKVLADQNFNLDNFKNQLQERIVNQTGSIEAAKLQAENITNSIKFAMDERQLDDQRDSQLAELQLKAAQGDQQAALDVQQLQVEQELRSLGLANDYADRLGSWLLSIVQGREQLSQERELFLHQLDEQARRENKGFLSSMISGIIGGAATVASGGAG